MMKYLAYMSRQSFELTDNDLSHLLDKARKNNEKKDITGLLVHVEGSFVQFIEGPDEPIQDLYATIKKDSRHQEIMVIAEGYSNKRHFTSWSMAFKRLDGENLDTLRGYRSFKPDELFEYPREKKEEKLPALTLLQHFVKDIAD